ncbi:hypothetical protein SAMN02982927_00019 [Sporolactobacillus nakayamae]|uniref:Uncharacterized protein n=1 Tax=Sporolactobacillus nakayamae TaxID=269670 RepID=A0A1I2MWU0_9BACL|nr:hypothetical protein SAMN02982927_00019 [Sporolactobacillus nakayamae]
MPIIILCTLHGYPVILLDLLERVLVGLPITAKYEAFLFFKSMIDPLNLRGFFYTDKKV